MPRVLCGCLFVAMLAGIAVAWARTPEGADPSYYGWFEALKQPGTGISCCSIADCRPTDYRLSADGYEAHLDEQWVRVPGDKIVHPDSNPIGRAIVCRSPADGAILCFVPASET